MANLTQALQLRVLTPYGTDPFNAVYGLDIRQAFVEASGPRMVKELIKLNLVRTLSSDLRVRDIRDISFVGDADYLEQHPALSQYALQTLSDERHRRFWRVEVVIETVTSALTTLDANVQV